MSRRRKPVESPAMFDSSRFAVSNLMLDRVFGTTGEHPARASAAVSSEKHLIARALGTDKDVQIDTRFEFARAGDVWLLCSDGLSNAVTDQRILEIVQSAQDLPTAAGRLVEAANESGGSDNITCVIAR